MPDRPNVRFLDRSTPPHIFTLIVLASLAALSMNMFLPSLPRMTTYFETDYRIMQLTIALYLGMNAVLQIFLGPLSDRFGRRPILLWSIAAFAVLSVGCVYAPNVETFLVLRAAQAVIVTGMVLSRAIARDMVPAEQAASMIGFIVMGMSLVPMFSPAIGGILDEAFGWKSNFWAFAILGAATLILVWADLGETSTANFTSFKQQFSTYPELLTSHRFWGYTLAAMFASGSFFAYLGGAPFVASELYGMDPSVVGFYFGAPAVGYLVGNFISGRYSVTIGMRRMVWIGSTLNFAGMAIAVAVFAAGLGSANVFFSLMTFVGLGNGMVLPNANAGMMSVRPHLAGTAAGLGGAIMVGGGAILSAFSGSVLTQDTGAMPLLLIMAASAFLGILAILYVIKRDRELATAQGTHG